VPEFVLYLELGFQHIADILGYDHIVFIVALCAGYTLREWRHVVMLATAFTLGHSLTLALATLGILILPTHIVELLIPVTIICTALVTIISPQKSIVENAIVHRAHLPMYVLALGFGCIHGLGFSNYLRALLGSEQSIIMPLFAFNVGLECGQLLIIAIALVAGSLATQKTRITMREWNLMMAGAAIGIACTIIIKLLTQL
jgi:hypothetical protein